MDHRQPPSDRPNTLGQAWSRMSRSRPRKVADLPVLPDWPPLPEEGLRIGWQPPRDDMRPPVERVAMEDDEQTRSSATTDPQRPQWPLRLDTSLLGRWRRASRRMKIGITSAILAAVLLIAGCSSLALHAVGGLSGSPSAPLFGASATQQATGLSGTPGSGATATSSSTATATSAATSKPTVPLTLAFTCASGSLRGTGKVCVHTVPSANLSLSVRYCDGTYAKGLRSAGIADGSGNYTWNWAIHITCVGPATATVSAKLNGQTITSTNTFKITA